MGSDINYTIIIICVCLYLKSILYNSIIVVLAAVGTMCLRCSNKETWEFVCEILCEHNCSVMQSIHNC